jgi:hypothetical protein
MAGVWDFGNHYYDGYTAKSYEYKPKWEMDIDYNPDHRRSTSGMFIEPDDRGNYRWVLSVRGLGALVMRAVADEATGKLDFKGVSTFTDAEIGHRK